MHCDLLIQKFIVGTLFLFELIIEHYQRQLWNRYFTCSHWCNCASWYRSHHHSCTTQWNKHIENYAHPSEKQWVKKASRNREESFSRIAHSTIRGVTIAVRCIWDNLEHHRKLANRYFPCLHSSSFDRSVIDSQQSTRENSRCNQEMRLTSTERGGEHSDCVSMDD